MTALGLKLLASVFMLIDHIGYCFYGPMILRIIGRLAFPIYVFQMTEGYRRTSNRLRYAVRLAIFGLISQVPFSLMIEAGLLALGIVIVLGVQMLYFREILQSDYGKTGILLALAFYYLYPSRRQPEPKGLLRSHRNQSTILLIACFLAVFSPTLIHMVGQFARALIGRPWSVAAPSSWSLAQLASLLALPLCLAYHGSRGWTPQTKAGQKALQFGFYAFYPVHMLILAWLKGIL